jgi:NADH dehydrogenase FAD-containing subunit
VPGHKNVYAVGDIAHYKQHPEGNQRRVEHWNVAGQQVSILLRDGGRGRARCHR